MFFITIDLRDDTFATEAEMKAILKERMDEVRMAFGRFRLEQIVITPHQEKLLKLELAEKFAFRWKNLKHKRLDNISNVPVILADEGEPVMGWGLHGDEEEW